MGGMVPKWKEEKNVVSAQEKKRIIKTQVTVEGKDKFCAGEFREDCNWRKEGKHCGMGSEHPC
jgi:hypothetical protein